MGVFGKDPFIKMTSIRLSLGAVVMMSRRIAIKGAKGKTQRFSHDARGLSPL